MEERERIPKKAHPVERANYLSRIFFTWVFPIFAKGYKNDLTEADLYEPRKVHESSQLGDTFESAWAEEIRKKHPSLWRVIFKVYWKDMVYQGFFPLYTEVTYEILQPMILKVLLEYYVPNQVSVTKEQAYWYAAALVGNNIIMIILGHTYMYATQHLGMKIRLSVCSLIYRKSLRLSKRAVGETSVGQIINLVSNDVRKFDMLFYFIHSLWTAPLMIILIMILIYQNLGAATLSGMVILILYLPVEAYLGKKSAKYYKKSAEKRDKRVGLMNEIITGIQVIKMYTWEKPFAKLVEQTRKAELKEIKGEACIRAITHSVWLYLTRLAVFLCIVIYIFNGYSLNAQYVFVTTSFYYTLRLSLGMIPWGFTTFMEAHESVKRIEKLLTSEEIDDTKLQKYKDDTSNGISNGNGTPMKKMIGIDLQNVSAKWDVSHAENTLENINFKAGPNQLIAIVGTVGSGKSTIIQIILEELGVSSGSLEVSGSISYASQEPWLFSGSIRQNILFGQKFDEVRYKKIIQVCALERDLKLFPHGDRTIIGEKGVMLSGGQKARINLARATYRESDIYLLDDPLSAVDTHVGKQLFDDCISGYLKDKCTVLITHQLQYLNSVDRIYLLEDGKVAASGSYREIQSHANEFSKLFKSEAEVKEKDEKENKLMRAISLKEQDEIPEEEKEENSTGKINLRIYKKYLKAGGSWFSALIVVFLFIATQAAVTCTEYFLTFWVNLEQDRFEAHLNYSASLSENSTSPLNISTVNDSTTHIADDSVLQKNTNDDVFTLEICMMIYSVLMGLIVVVALARSFNFYRFCLKASQVLHNNMFEQISTATMRFFHTNPAGRILNRFSSDMGLIDDNLIETLVDTLQLALMVLSIVTLVCTVNIWFLIPTGCIFILFYCFRMVFIATSRDLKRIEGTTRSPMLSHFTASLQGLTTIRAYGAQNLLRKEYDNHQNLYSSAYYTEKGISRAFAFWLDMNCVVYVAIVIASFFIIGTEKYGGNVGLAITQAISLTGILQYGIRQWSELENQMTGVERVIQYTEVASEPNSGKTIPRKGWPSKGSIEFNGVSLRYSPTDPYVLNNLNFIINPKEKIGIVGRTGAGKSSLITTLFRLAEIEGDILIDKVKTNDISLQNLRRILSIIPQEPVLFSGTIRKNLDPFDEYNDEKLWDSLSEVELKQSIFELPSGLHSSVSDGGSNFSVGQRQLFCLARAVLRSNKILVLDEATANVDPQTDELIQKTIRRKFNDCTVLTIAHRLHTIMDSDRVLVMDEGRLVEFDHPHSLIRKRGVFYELVMKTGTAATKNLEEIAQQSYNRRGS